jgi:hypothetical protein
MYLADTPVFTTVKLSTKSSGVWCRVALSLITNVSEEPTASEFRVEALEDGDNAFPRNIGNYLQNNASQYRRQNSHKQYIADHSARMVVALT